MKKRNFRRAANIFALSVFLILWVSLEAMRGNPWEPFARFIVGGAYFAFVVNFNGWTWGAAAKRGAR